MNRITINNELAVRLIICGLALFNAVADMCGWPHLEIGPEDVTTCVNVILLVATSVWGFWKNNNFTEAAKESQEVLDILKEDPQAKIKVITNDEES